MTRWIHEPAEFEFKPEPDYARIAVLQTEREHVHRELIRLGNRQRFGNNALVERYDALDKAIREGISE